MLKVLRAICLWGRIMADITIPDKCTFEVGTDQIRLSTQTNGDTIYIKGVHLGEENAAALAYLINMSQNHLKVVIKEVE